MNPFLELAERQTPAPVAARLRAVEKRRANRLHEHHDEERALSFLYRQWRKQELDDALASDDGDKLRDLIEQLDALTLETIPQLTAFVRASGWHTAAATTLFMARRLASESIIRLREKNSLAPFDDPVPGAPATPEWELHTAFAEHEESNDNG